MVIALNAVQAEDQDGKSRQGREYYLALGRTHNMQAHDHAVCSKKYAALSDRAPADIIHDHVAAIRFNADAAESFSPASANRPATMPPSPIMSSNCKSVSTM